ncbi:MAG TPA: c-type cytochrome [Gaiellaceae bacterium]|nr:c-type cytochrome [Gaiellaceae bacterium]
MRTVAVIVLALAFAGSAGAQTGKNLFGQFCAACHSVGPTRIGAGPGREMRQQDAAAPSLRGVGAMAADFYLSTGYMPLRKVGLEPRRSRKVLSPGEISELTSYVASLGGGPAIPSPHPERGTLSEGMHLFSDHCAGCHQIVGEGGYANGAVPPPLEDASDVQIAEAVRIGPWVMPTFTKKAITDKQLDSIIRYVDYAKHPDDRGGWAIGHLGPIPEGLVTWFIGAVLLVAFCMSLGKRLKSS